MADLITKAADLRDRVTIQYYLDTQETATGEPVMDDSAWGEDEETWADVQTLSGRDYITANQSAYVATHKVFLRFRQGLLIKRSRLIFGTATLYVVHINNMMGKNAKLELLCRSASPAGV